jgi:uncharacterized repeat protein (TIGR03806 family)
MSELGPGVSGNWSAVVAFPNLGFQNAVGLCPFPDSNRLVVWEREGRIWSFENSPETRDKTLVLDIHDQCQGWDDSGLLGVAFHPNFKVNHYVYIWYAWVTPGTVAGDSRHRPPTNTPNHDRLSRFTLNADGVADPKSELILIDEAVNKIWHKGGGMFFHPKTGFLHLTIGEDTDGSNAQRIDHKLLGGIIRIDVDQRGGDISHPIKRQPAEGHTDHYFIPNDNPFVGRPDSLEEFYAIGLRSPHRMTYEAISGRTFIGDVGDASREEIDIIEPTDPPPRNFQWPVIEGLRGDLTGNFLGFSHRPVIDYDHGEGTAVIGGYVYRGKRWADDLGGKYIFGDNGTRRIWVLDEIANPPAKVQLCTVPNGRGPNSGSNYVGLSSFGVDRDGELYMCQMSSEEGRIYRLQRTGPPPVRRPPPRLLSQTGAFADVATLTPAPGLVPYTVNSPLWSDGAAKQRWMALPVNTTIHFSAEGEWRFPAGTVLVKHFELPVDERHPETRRRLETRLLVLDSTGSAYGLTYKWRPDNSDADLLATGLNETIDVHNADGAVHQQAWSYPSPTDCMQCHTSAAGYVLGPKSRQLNRDFTDPQTQQTGNQISQWARLGLFDKPPTDQAIAALDALVPIDRTSAPLESRVRSYLDANCSNCHRPGGVHTLWDARFDTPLQHAGIINAGLVANTPIANARVVRPGDPARSILYRRVSSIDGKTRMPPLGHNIVDAPAAAAIEQWISQMPESARSLPQGWLADDVGSGMGDESFSAGTFKITGAGNDIWENADAFHFVHQPLQGDGQITARVVSITGGQDWAKIGVMIRDGLEADARHASMFVTPTQGTAFQRRTGAGQASQHAAGPERSAPQWVRLVRKGNELTALVSDDGAAWSTVGSVNIDLPADAQIGLAVCSHDPRATCTAAFDHVSVEQSGH